MNELSVHLTQIEILRTGADGGHLYLLGKCDHDGRQGVHVYAYFSDKAQEKGFEQSWQGQDLLVTSSRWEFDPSAGLRLEDIEYRAIE